MVQLDRINLASALFEEGFSCSQAVFAAFARDYGLDRTTALKLSQGFSGGMGGQGLTCGAATGAYMVIGLKYGRYLPDDVTSKEKTTEVVNAFTALFLEENGKLACSALLGHDVSTEVGKEKIEVSGVRHTVCPKAVKTAAAILEKLL